jgi:hypothetical protein
MTVRLSFFDVSVIEILSFFLGNRLEPFKVVCLNVYSFCRCVLAMHLKGHFFFIALKCI